MSLGGSVVEEQFCVVVGDLGLVGGVADGSRADEPGYSLPLVTGDRQLAGALASDAVLVADYR
jgi:hypothetical protein